MIDDHICFCNYEGIQRKQKWRRVSAATPLALNITYIGFLCRPHKLGQFKV